jgi:signal transduction histidine kinase
MTAIFTETPQRVIALASQTTDWMTHLQLILSVDGFTLQVFASCKELTDTSTQTSLEALVTVFTPENIEYLKQHRSTHFENTLLVLITDDVENISEDIWEICDAVLPQNTTYLEHQIKKLLQIQRKNSQLQHQTTVLTTQVQTLEAELKTQKTINSEADMLKNAIIHNVSHELRTPLLHVKSAVSMLGESLKELPQERKVLEYAEEATGRLESLVKNITLLGSSLEYNPIPIILRDAIEYAKRNLGRIWQRKGDIERIKVTLEPQLPPILADKQGLNTVLQLLMDNALKFSEKDVIISAKLTNDMIEVSIQDFGIGIAQEQIQNVFKYFYQIDSSTTRRYGGAGVGLPIVKMILDHHQTEIKLNSELGKGSTFSFRLPIIDLSKK